MADISPFSTVAAAAALFLCLGYLAVQRAYPSPLPGIPYNLAATKRLFGDLPEIADYAQKHGSFRSWFLEQAHRHNSAITQVFLGPLSKTAVIVSDYREVNDILSHRDAVDFKRGLKVEAFRGILPHAFPAMETFDPSFKVSRELAKDLMTPTMLQMVNAPRIYGVACHLVELWRMKSRLSGGRPFDVSDDISEFSFDAILSAAIGLGPKGGDLKRQLGYLAKYACKTSVVDNGAYSPVTFPKVPHSAKLTALRIEENSLWKGFVAPWPRLYHQLNKLRPSVRAARHTLQGYIASQIAQAIPGLANGSQDPQCALDFVIQRELSAAAKECRPPALADPRILEPIYGYLIAGHDTSSGSLLWLIHRLVTNPAEQDRLRLSLRTTYPAAWREKRLPTVTELVKTRSPYADAFIEETLRCDTPVANIMVMTRHNTFVLGHHIPADTRVFLNLTGASLNQQSVPVDEVDRRHTSRMHKPATARENWDNAAPEKFLPERWLKKNDANMPVFDAAAGPALAFSAGNRGCWGKRLGYLELRIVLALLVWSFEFGASDEFTNWKTCDTLVTAPKCCIIRIKEAS